MNAEKSVVIVGAGASGIAAASLLAESGVSFTILEAEDRIGGRIFSARFGESKVDLGAQWSHGEQKNTMYDLIRDLDLVKPSEFRKNLYYSGEVFDVALADELYRLCKGIFLKGVPVEDVSVGRFVEERFREVVEAKYGLGENVTRLAGEVLDTFMHDVLVQRGAQSWYDISMRNDYDRLKGQAYLDWKGRGHGIILDVMMKRYPNTSEQLPIAENIIFNQEVSKIHWNGPPSIRCVDGSQYFANHIIFTPSLGVLKHGHRELFQPALPSAKIDAINSLGIASVLKVILEFTHRWWDVDDFKTATLCWATADLEQLAREFPKGPIKHNRSWLENLCEFYALDENPNVLAAWFTGEFVPDIELLPDDTIIDGLTFALRKFFRRKYEISPPVRLLRSNWNSNRHFRGVYSYETLESRRLNGSAASVLSMPLTLESGEVSLLFAGEATSPTHYATVHGAIEAGYREARRIIQLDL
ncbi:spermine oxidase-like isoform X2 [Photinus pyralis]|uniref:spermine oxidase-like isoform X2 n=1 Tax=Photinus pyralis TaxID=7054 RepID=UPI001266FE97|nr:spermine oxidase-like isoform X2 [Photinus pyralis]